MEAMSRYTKEQADAIVRQLQAIQVDGKPVFVVGLMDARNETDIELEQVLQSGMLYLVLRMKDFQKRFPFWIVVE